MTPSQSPRPPGILSPKLRPPTLPPDFVSRSRVHELLSAGRGRRLTLVCAPAGFGKTIALAGWLHEDRRPSVWVSLDELDSNLVTFTSVFVSALRTVVPGAGLQALALVAQTASPPLSLLTALIADDLAKLNDELIVVLDDVHLIQEPSIYELLSLLVRRLPPTLQLVIASRDEPPLHVARLRGQGELAEVRTDDLRFDWAEAATFIRGMGPGSPDDRLITDTVTRSDGWAVGLRLLTLVGVPADSSRIGTAPTRERQFVDAYLFDEVLSRQRPELQRFLTQTSILERFCAPLCEAVVDGLQPGDAGRLLDESMRTGLFLVALDDEQCWYRYHHLFRDMMRRRLKRELGSEHVRALVMRAGIWLGANGLLEDAATSAFETGDLLRTTALIEQLLPTWQQREQWATVDVWIRRLPPDAVAKSLVLGMARRRLLTRRCEFGALERELRRFESQLTQPQAPPLDPTDLNAALGQINVGFAYLLHETGGDDGKALEHALLAIQQLPEDRAEQRGGAYLFHAVTLQCLGRTEEALTWIRAELDKEAARRPTIIARLLNAKAYVELSSGQLDAASHTARELVALARAGDHPLHLGWAHSTLGHIAYAWNDLAGAGEHFNAVLSLGDRAHRICTVNAAGGLALSLAALGQHREAEHLVLRELAWAEEEGNAFFVVRLRSLMARLALLSPAPDRAAHWSAGVAFTQGAITAFDLEDPRLTRAQVLVADPTAERLDEASGVLERALDAAHARHIVSSVVKGLALRAIVERSRGEASTAFRSMTDALTIAAPGRFLRPFVDLGPPLTRLLVELASHGPLPAGGERVLDACQSGSGTKAPSLPGRNRAAQPLAETLTWRELDVLSLMDGHQTNKQIAQRLSISEETVKKHAANIYGKLQAKGRRDAVIRAYDLGVLRAEDRRTPRPA